MAWGRIDDAFDDHPKVVSILDEEDQSAAAFAIALWTLCFTWAHRNTRKRGQVAGRLPAGLPRRFFGALAKDGAQLLVKHRLWDELDDGGWMIHDFNDYLPTDDTRAARSAAGKRGAAKRWGSAKDDSNLPSSCHEGDSNENGNPNGPDSQADANGSGDADSVEEAPSVDAGRGADPLRPSTGASADEETAGHDGKLPSSCHEGDSKPVASDGSRTQARARPTPIPTPKRTPKTPSSSSDADKPRSTKRGTRIPDDFAVTPDMVTWARERAPTLDGRRETEKFINYYRAKTGANATKLDWPATWRNWMLNAADRAPGNGHGPPGTTVVLHGQSGRPSTTDQRVTAALHLAAQLDQEAS